MEFFDALVDAMSPFAVDITYSVDGEDDITGSGAWIPDDTASRRYDHEQQLVYSGWLFVSSSLVETPSESATVVIDSRTYSVDSYTPGAAGGPHELRLISRTQQRVGRDHARAQHS